MKTVSILAALLLLVTPNLAWSATATHETLDLTTSMVGYLSLLVFVLAYLLVIFEEQLHLRKSKPVLLAAGLIWIMIAIAYQNQGFDHAAEVALRHNFLEYAELFFFLLVAMTYINAMIERRVFDALRDWLVAKGFSYRALFWLTGVLAFFISPVADNRSEEHTSELQSRETISYAVFCLKKKKENTINPQLLKQYNTSHQS